MGIIVICGFFEKEDGFGYPTGEKEFGVSHGVDMITGQSVVLPCVSHSVGKYKILMDNQHRLRGDYQTVFREF